MQWTYQPQTYTYRVAFGSFSEGMILDADLISDSIEVTFSQVTTKHVVRVLGDCDPVGDGTAYGSGGSR